MCHILEGGEQLSVDQRECGGEGSFGYGESRNQHAIASSGGGQVGNGVDSFLLIDKVGGVLVDMIGSVVASTRSGGLQLTQFLMGGGKNVFELGPGLVRWVPSLPKLAIVIE